MSCQQLKFNIYSRLRPNQAILIVCLEEYYSVQKTWEIVKNFNRFETQVKFRFYSVVAKRIPEQWDRQILEPIKQVSWVMENMLVK